MLLGYSWVSDLSSSPKDMGKQITWLSGDRNFQGERRECECPWERMLGVFEKHVVEQRDWSRGRKVEYKIGKTWGERTGQLEGHCLNRDFR